MKLVCPVIGTAPLLSPARLGFASCRAAGGVNARVKRTSPAGAR